MDQDRAQSSAIGGDAAERRARSDRRAGAVASGDRRGARHSKWRQAAKVVVRDVVMIAATLGAMIVSIRYTKPIFANQPSVVAALTKSAPAPIAPIATAALETAETREDSLAQLVKSPEFERERKAFAADLVATGRMSPGRADSVAYYAVREAYVRKIPPAVIYGVMLTENARFISHALSNVGAVGLMQVYPKWWLKPLQGKFGKDLTSDSTNLKYGVYILAEYIKTNEGRVDPAVLNKGLLRYNGCVRGTNTPHCKNYPSKVKKYVEQGASAICGDKTFYQCIAKPFSIGLLGKEPGTEAAQGPQ
jgi:soluble lytic murein transglycosylase-like protein